MNKRLENNKGVALFIAIMVCSILTIIIGAILNISYNEIKLSNSGKESQVAFFAANTGMECALYWDYKMGLFKPGSYPPIDCSEEVVTMVPGGTCGSGNLTSCYTTYAFMLNRLASSNSCVDVSIRKTYNGSGELSTRVISTGKNIPICSSYANPDRTYERSIQIDY
jgi:hypothetical protein